MVWINKTCWDETLPVSETLLLRHRSNSTQQEQTNIQTKHQNTKIPKENFETYIPVCVFVKCDFELWTLFKSTLNASDLFSSIPSYNFLVFFGQIDLYFVWYEKGPSINVFK